SLARVAAVDRALGVSRSCGDAVERRPGVPGLEEHGSGSGEDIGPHLLGLLGPRQSGCHTDSIQILTVFVNHAPAEADRSVTAERRAESTGSPTARPAVPAGKRSSRTQAGEHGQSIRV